MGEKGGGREGKLVKSEGHGIFGVCIMLIAQYAYGRGHTGSDIGN